MTIASEHANAVAAHKAKVDAIGKVPTNSEKYYVKGLVPGQDAGACVTENGECHLFVIERDDHCRDRGASYAIPPEEAANLGRFMVRVFGDEDTDSIIADLVSALKPFAKYHCGENVLGCSCHNCLARDALAKAEEKGS
jgi:hypothetical protein